MTPPIDVEDFQGYFDRDFVYGEAINTVREKDIQRAINEASLNFNESLFGTEDLDSDHNTEQDIAFYT